MIRTDRNKELFVLPSDACHKSSSNQHHPRVIENTTKPQCPTKRASRCDPTKVRQLRVQTQLNGVRQLNVRSQSGLNTVRQPQRATTPERRGEGRQHHPTEERGQSNLPPKGWEERQHLPKGEGKKQHHPKKEAAPPTRREEGKQHHRKGPPDDLTTRCGQFSPKKKNLPKISEKARPNSRSTTPLPEKQRLAAMSGLLGERVSSVCGKRFSVFCW